MKPKHFTDERLLEWIEDGSLIVEDVDGEHPRLVFMGREIKAELTQQQGRNYLNGSERWTWQLCCGSYKHRGRKKRRRRRIVRAKLVWMFVNRRVVPPDHHVHHGPLGRLHDGIGNLECLHYLDHDALHNGNGHDDDF